MVLAANDAVRERDICNTVLLLIEKEHAMTAMQMIAVSIDDNNLKVPT